jgi:hypothetical protein
VTTRLAASLIATSLIRRAESEGGVGTVLAKGDLQAGSILVILNEKGRNQGLLERILQPDGGYKWQPILGQNIENKDEFERLLARRRSFDPDLWLIELDVASAERFAAEMNSGD